MASQNKNTIFLMISAWFIVSLYINEGLKARVCRYLNQEA